MGRRNASRAFTRKKRNEMNKKTIITILLALVAMAGHGQEIKKVAATPEDFMEHMALCGYEVYTYDISSLRDSVSGFTIVIREYNQCLTLEKVDTKVN